MLSTWTRSTGLVIFARLNDHFSEAFSCLRIGVWAMVWASLSHNRKRCIYMIMADERVLGYSSQADKRPVMAGTGWVGHTRCWILFTTAAVRASAHIEYGHYETIIYLTSRAAPSMYFSIRLTLPGLRCRPTRRCESGVMCHVSKNALLLIVARACKHRFSLTVTH